MFKHVNIGNTVESDPYLSELVTLVITICNVFIVQVFLVLSLLSYGVHVISRGGEVKEEYFGEPYI